MPVAGGARSDSWTAREGSARPLGVSWVEPEDAYNFALYSKHATAVTLELYGADDAAVPGRRLELDPLRNRSGRIWHCRLSAAEVDPFSFYAYRVDGPRDLASGQRFDPDKVLLDPYARAVHFPSAFSRQAAVGPGSNAGRAPLGVIRAGSTPFDWSGDRRPRHTHDAIVYETHVRGFTRRANSGVAPEARGTFTGLIEKIPYLQELGVTVVELMPVHQFDPDEGNYWGYMPLSFFSVHDRYASRSGADEQLDEFRELVKALHQADIEVVLDVVYNHTTETDENGPTYGFRGIDNTTYYLLEEDRSRYRNDAGTGNVLHTANRAVRAMVLDSLRFWVREAHVDGFRFDLASIFTRRSDGTLDLEDPPIISAIRSDPDLADVRLIAEAWDISSYQLGRSFPGVSWLQWNGRFRDDLRAFAKSDSGRVADAMRRVYGSDDLFPDTLPDAYHAYQSVNFVTAHDGFSLYDLVSYQQKHNEANGHGNSDGTDDNRSWNCGWEGDQGVPQEVVSLRMRQIRNFCCLLLLSNGTPMLVAGDEFGNTQQGNNNPYNQDNETTWLDWDLLAQRRDLFHFFQQMIAFRKAHPSLGRSRFWREDVRWYGVDGATDLSPPSRTFAFFLSGASEQDQDLYVMVNAWWEPLSFRIAEGPTGSWRRVADTSLPSPDDILEPDSYATLPGDRYTVGPRSVVLLIREPGT